MYAETILLFNFTEKNATKIAQTSKFCFMTFDWVNISDCNETGKIAQKRVNNPWNINWFKYPVAVRYIHSNHINVINKIVLDFINKFFPHKKTNKQNHKQKKNTKRAPWMKWSELNDIRLWNVIYTHERLIHQATDRKRRREKKKLWNWWQN